jgi:hypothetical protein
LRGKQRVVVVMNSAGKRTVIIYHFNAGNKRNSNLKHFALTLLVLFPILVAARPKNDSLKTSFKSEIEFSIVDGYFDIKQTNSYGLYESSGQQYSYGLSYKHTLSKMFWAQLAFYYTEDKYNLNIYYPNGLYAEPPTMSKTLGVLDIGAFLGFDFLHAKKLTPYILGGIFISPLIKGKDYLKGIYREPQLYYFKDAELKQFNSTSSTMLAIGIKYYFVKHIAVDLQIDWRHFLSKIVPDERIKNPTFNFMAGVTYRF